MTGWLVMLQGFNIPSEGMWFWFEGMIDIFFYFDLALNFFTAYEVSNNKEQHRPLRAGCIVRHCNAAPAVAAERRIKGLVKRCQA